MFFKKHKLKKGKSISVTTNAPAITDAGVKEKIEESWQNERRLHYEYLSGKHNIFNDNNLNEYEELFFIELSNALAKNSLLPHELRLKRLADGTFNVDYASQGYVGKIRLVKQKKYMQYCIGKGDPKVLYSDNIQDYIYTIPRWIKYIKYMKKNSY